MHQLSFRRAHDYTGASSVTIPIKLRANGRAFSLQASVDTGAEFCLFQRTYADSLGFDVESGIPLRFATANSHFLAYGHDVEIEALGLGTHSFAYFFEDVHIRKNVLGREGWLNRVRLGLEHHDSRLYLSGANGE